MQQFLRTILQFLYPKSCAVCGRFGTALCTQCIETIPLASAPEGRDNYAVFDYGNPIVRRAVWQFKYHRQSAEARALAEYAAPFIAEFLSEILQSTSTQPIVLVPIPQHRNKRALRGYNQSAVLSGWLARSLEGAAVQTLLIKTVPTVPQARTKNKSARIKNIAHSMRAQELVPESVYVIVDDVMTTGATVNEARRALRAGGGKKIIAVALAHGYLSS